MKYLLILLYLSLSWKVYSQNFPLDLSKIKSDCETEERVRDIKPESCSLPEGYILYPVYVEDFNYKNELPNNWSFKWGCPLDDDMSDGGGEGFCWIGNGQDALESYHRDLLVTGGVAHLQINQTSSHNNLLGCTPSSPCNGTCVNKDYHFTTTVLNGYFRFREGKTEAEIRIPNNDYMWPAFWLYGDDEEEIDIFEFWDSQVSQYSPCDVYPDMRMTFHGKNNNKSCSRGRVFPVSDLSNNFLDNFHTYTCSFNDFEVNISVDNTLVGRATKFYRGTLPPHASNTCHYRGDHLIPAETFNCSQTKALPNCLTLVELPGGGSQCLAENKVFVDNAFPTPNARPMVAKINNSINQSGSLGNQNYDAILTPIWSSLAQKDKEIAVDRYVLWQPLNCGLSFNLPTEADFNFHSGSTSFLGGHDITIGSTTGNLIFQPQSNIYDGIQKNIQLLATDYIAFVGDVEINSGGSDIYTYLRAEIIDCSGARPVNENDLNEINPEAGQNTTTTASDIQSMIISDLPKPEKFGKSETDNGAILLYPNPASDILNISMTEEDYYDLIRLEITDNLGRKLPVVKSKGLNISDLSPGYYQLKFFFSHGLMVVKSFIKK